MIFNLFSSKSNWQHKDSNVRIAAVNEELTTNNSDDKATLLNLLNEDKSELVRRAVLLKFNDFDRFLTASLKNNNESIQVFAQKKIKDILSGTHSISLSIDDKQALLDESIASRKEGKEQRLEHSLLVFWLEQESNPILVNRLFKILAENRNYSQFLIQIFSKKQCPEIQKSLLTANVKELTDVTLLNKLMKKAVNKEVITLINERLTKINEKKEKPKRVLKHVQLLLSKLLALKDQSDYSHYLVHKNLLGMEWQQSLSEISCLNEEDQNTLLVKFEKITEQLNQIFAPKEEAYQQKLIEEKLQKDKELAKDSFNSRINELNKKITTAVFEGQNADIELINQNEFNNSLTKLSEDINESVLNNTEQNDFLKQVIQLEKRLTQLPEIASSVSEATYLISKISQITLPQSLSDFNERYQMYQDWQHSYNDVNKKAYGVLPQSIVDAHNEITKLWQNGIKPFQLEQKKLFDQTKKKLNDLKRLLNSGKYKVCFGLFKGVSENIEYLSSKQKQQIQRDFENVSKKMAEISDWEHYIATPRKQELLLEINNLIATPLDDLNAQADKVKQFRKTWNLLGHADESIDKELNNQFNIACEQAFAPCRLFYAEQDKVRATHLIERKEILALAKEYAEVLKTEQDEQKSIDFKSLDGKLNTLNQRWQKAGEVDRQAYQKVFKQYKNAIQPIKNAIKTFHEANGLQKKTLIENAEQQLLVENIFQAIENVKQLQQDWREVGFAGSHQEYKLWQKFREVNDQVFAKREQEKSKQEAVLADISGEFNARFESIKDTISDNNNDVDKHSYIQAKVEAEALLKQVLAKKPVIKSIATEIEDFLIRINKEVISINKTEERKVWQSLFKLFEKIINDPLFNSEEVITNDNDYKLLNSFWQKRVIEQLKVKNLAEIDKRADKTLELEILAQVKSPSELANRRMVIQVQLMQDQMQSKDEIDLSELVVDWLSLGKLTETDLGLVNRLHKIFANK